MKLAIAIADTDALPSAFVVFRGFSASIAKAARLGYDGVELALKHPDEVDRTHLRGCLRDAGITVSCISTGQVFAGLGLMATDPDPDRRQRLRDILFGLIDLAGEFGGMVNLGRVRGSIGQAPRDAAEARFLDMAWELCHHAATRQVTLLLEPVNRYEMDFINSVEEGAALMDRVGRANMKLMPDVFHMNIEDRAIGPELARWVDHIGYIHLADSNRLAPGQGHTDFDAILRDLAAVRFDGWVSVEILPKPDPDSAARQAAEFLRPRVDAYNLNLRKGNP